MSPPPPPTTASASSRGSSRELSSAPEVTRAAASPSLPKYKRKKSARDRRLVAQRAEEASKLYNLVLDVNSFRQQIYELTVRRDLLQARVRRERLRRPDAVASTVRKYFEGFKNGHRASDVRQCNFVRSIASDTFRLGRTAQGVDMLLEQWRRYTLVFAIQHVDLISTEPVLLDTSTFEGKRGWAVFKCAAEFRGALTRDAVDTVFPNARTHQWELLQALGSVLVCPMLFHLYFDLDGTFLRQDLTSDFSSAFHHLLGGDTALAACFLDGARVGDESMIESPRR